MPSINENEKRIGCRTIECVVLLVAVLGFRVADASERPNIVILYADDMGVADVSYGEKSAKIQTPHIDSLARSGMAFSDGHSSSGICTPSRFALLTGQHHWRRFHGIVGPFGGSVFERDDFTIAKMFKMHGYETGCFGKWHLGWDWDAIRKPNVGKKDLVKAESYDWNKSFPGGPLEQGFDQYFGDGVINFPPYCWIENDRFQTIPTKPVIKSEPLAGGGTFRPGPMAETWNPYDILPTITKKTVEWIEGQKGDKPFFAYLAFNSPHYPIVPNEEFHGKSEAGYYGDFVIETDAMVGKVLAALKKKEEGKPDFRKQFQNNMKTKTDNMRKQKLLDNGAKELKRLREERANIDVNDAQVQNTKNTYDSKHTSMRTSQDAQEDY